MFLRRKKEEKEAGEEIQKSNPKPKKVEKEDDGMVWDKKRILIGVAVLFIAFLAVRELKDMFFPNTNILGESTVRKPSEVESPNIGAPDVNLESKVGSTVSEIKENINTINPEEVASSSPQIQKVLRDIQGLKDLPSEKAKNACMKVCSQL